MVSVNYEGAGIYQHYKGGMYEVLGLGVREETIVKPHDNTPEPKWLHPVIVVIYKPLTPGSMLGKGELRGVDFWTRDLEVFDARVLPEGVEESIDVSPPKATMVKRDQTVPRFKKVGEPRR